MFDAPARHDDVDEVIRPLREVGKSRRSSHVVEKPLQDTLERQILIRTPNDAKSKRHLTAYYLCWTDGKSVFDNIWLFLIVPIAKKEKNIWLILKGFISSF